MKRFEGLYSLGEAAEMLGVDASVLRNALRKGYFENGVEAKMFGKQWVITAEAIERYRTEYRRHGYGRAKIDDNAC